MGHKLACAGRANSRSTTRAGWIAWCVALAVLVMVSVAWAYGAFGTFWGFFLIADVESDWDVHSDLVGWAFIVHGGILLLSLVLALLVHSVGLLGVWQWVCWTLAGAVAIGMVAAFGLGLFEAGLLASPAIVAASLWAAGALALAGRAVGVARRHRQA